MKASSTQIFKNLVYRQHHSAKILHFYRLIIAALLVAQILLPEKPLLNINDTELFSWVSFLYLVIALFWLLISWQPTKYEEQLLSIQIYFDIFIIIILMHSCGGVESGLGILLIISIIMTSLLCTQALTITFAAVATVGLLSEYLYSNLSNLGQATGSSQVGLLGIALFATAFVSIRLTKEIRIANALAQKQQTDLDNLSALNDYIIDNMQSGVIALDAHFNIQHVNHIAAELLHLPVLLRTHLSRVHSKLWQTLNRWISENEKAPIDRIYLPNESQIDNVQIRFKHMVNAKQSGFLIFLDDLSLMHKQANQSKLAALGHLTANIAHEIRNPLGAISHASQLLSESSNLDKTDIRMTEIIAQHSDRINHIIEDILKISRNKKMARQCINIETWLNQFIHDFCLGASNATLDCFAPSILTQNNTILFDSGHLSQVLTNVCQNAKTHGISDRPVHIFTHKSEHLFTIEVADEGPGLSMSERQKVTEPFYTTSKEGSGLGLYIVSQLCEINSATLEITQNNFQGTSVKIHCELAND